MSIAGPALAEPAAVVGEPHPASAEGRVRVDLAVRAVLVDPDRLVAQHHVGERGDRVVVPDAVVVGHRRRVVVLGRCGSAADERGQQEHRRQDHDLAHDFLQGMPGNRIPLRSPRAGEVRMVSGVEAG